MQPENGVEGGDGWVGHLPAGIVVDGVVDIFHTAVDPRASRRLAINGRESIVAERCESLITGQQIPNSLGEILASRSGSSRILKEVLQLVAQCTRSPTGCGGLSLQGCQ